MDTHELVQRIRQSSVNDNALDALGLTVEQAGVLALAERSSELRTVRRVHL